MERFHNYFKAECKYQTRAMPIVAMRYVGAAGLSLSDADILYPVVVDLLYEVNGIVPAGFCLVQLMARRNNINTSMLACGWVVHKEGHVIDVVPG